MVSIGVKESIVSVLVIQLWTGRLSVEAILWMPLFEGDTVVPKVIPTFSAPLAWQIDMIASRQD